MFVEGGDELGHPDHVLVIDADDVDTGLIQVLAAFDQDADNWAVERDLVASQLYSRQQRVSSMDDRRAEPAEWLHVVDE
ncbi:hypothetical protein EA472_18015 [Natrarchaeobius oligotrophus]|uniref:Uncharacterized protein n=1 Tax=Natrarchaeobius chitinivorans TaxID=1679083 RepID=A0A3N6PER5_NATCH|nr:hypothetical protein EA472_18015 [Natrarchaeobius chitinivorans]